MPMLNCLVVEDEPGIGWAIRRLLEPARAAVTVAASGASALEHMRRQRFSMIFLDVKLPDADGFELAERIRQLTPAAPIVMLSAYFYPNDPKVRQMIEGGVARRFIGKPFRHDEIIAAVQELTSNDTPWHRFHSAESTPYGIAPRNPHPRGRHRRPLSK